MLQLLFSLAANTHKLDRKIDNCFFNAESTYPQALQYNVTHLMTAKIHTDLSNNQCQKQPQPHDTKSTFKEHLTCRSASTPNTDNVNHLAFNRLPS